MAKIRVGIPGALMYYLYFPFWRTFFNGLKVDVVTSGPTTKELLDHGVREALNDACVPLKVFFGHVAALKDKTDYLFIPRLVCLNRHTVYCPKFLGLPDMIKHSMVGLPPVIDERIDVRSGRAGIFRTYRKVATQLGSDLRQTTRALYQAQMSQRRYMRLLHAGFPLAQAIADDPPPVRPQEQPFDLTFGVLGYPYAVHDYFLNGCLIDKLHRLKVKVLTADNLPPRCLAHQSYDLPKQLFWTLSDQMLRAAYWLFEEAKVDGIIHVSVFGCGPDSITNKLMELKAKLHRTTPFMTLTIDEHTGEAGLTTRLEAFADMVLRRKEAASCLK